MHVRNTMKRGVELVTGAVGHGADRLLHGRRRRRAMARLAERRPSCVLFVCHGNQCRSPYAAASLVRQLGDPVVRVMSAGFVGPGRPVPREAESVARGRGLDLGEHRSQLLGSELLDAAELIVVMEEKQRRAIVRRFGRSEDVVVLGDLDPKPIRTRSIADPQGREVRVFAVVYARIDRCVAALVRSLGKP
jgi:protein-tyrosine-phosphatase